MESDRRPAVLTVLSRGRQPYGCPTPIATNNRAGCRHKFAPHSRAVVRSNRLYEITLEDSTSRLTPGITRPPTSLKAHEINRVAGRARAVVGRVSGASLSVPRRPALPEQQGAECGKPDAEHRSKDGERVAQHAP